jgi:hypothetical protein
MAVTAKRARALALSLDNAVAIPHFERLAFRTPRRIFATLGPGGRDMNFMFDLLQQAEFCAEAPAAISPVPGGWGRMGATSCNLEIIDAATFERALRAAHARANEPRGGKRSKLRAKKQPKRAPPKRK